MVETVPDNWKGSCSLNHMDRMFSLCYETNAIWVILKKRALVLQTSVSCAMRQESSPRVAGKNFVYTAWKFPSCCGRIPIFSTWQRSYVLVANVTLYSPHSRYIVDTWLLIRSVSAMFCRVRKNILLLPHFCNTQKTGNQVTWQGFQGLEIFLVLFLKQ